MLTLLVNHASKNTCHSNTLAHYCISQATSTMILSDILSISRNSISNLNDTFPVLDSSYAFGTILFAFLFLLRLREHIVGFCDMMDGVNVNWGLEVWLCFGCSHLLSHSFHSNFNAVIAVNYCIFYCNQFLTSKVSDGVKRPFISFGREIQMEALEISQLITVILIQTWNI